MKSSWLRRAAVLGAVLAAALVLGAVGLNTAVAQEPDDATLEVVASRPQPGDMMTTVLQPGDNLVGWIEGTTSVAELFDAVAEIETVWTWDALRRQWSAASRRVPSELHTLRTLKPGMGLLVQVGGNEPVEWLRSAYPAAGLVKLHEGPNLVAWSGREESPISYLALGIGTSFNGAEIWDATSASYLSYEPEAGDTERFPTIRRGDALWVDAERTVNWLQPTGVLPRITFTDAVPSRGRPAIRSTVANVLDFFASQHGIEADYSLLTLHVEGLGGPSPWVGGRTFAYIPGGPECFHRRIASCLHVLAHEYFHVVQRQLAEVSFGTVVDDGPLFLTEGSAELMARRVIDSFPNIAQDRKAQPELLKRSLTAADPVDVESLLTVHRYDSTAYLLAQRLDDASIIEYYRQLAPALIGPEFRWESRPSWQDVFRRVVGVPVAQFYVEMDELIRNTPGRAMYEEAQLGIQGTLVGEDGTPIPDVAVGPVVGGRHIQVHARTDSSGGFRLRVLPTSLGGEFTLRIVTANCTRYYGDAGLTFRKSDATPIALNGDVTDVSIKLAELPCGVKMQGRIVGDDNAGLKGVMVPGHNRDDGIFPFLSAPSGDDGRFTSWPSPTMTVWLSEGCSFDAIAANENSDGVVVFKVPANVCVRQITGRILALTGAGAPGMDVSVGCATSSARGSATRADGSFMVTVPTEGPYCLRFTCYDPRWDGYSGAGNEVVTDAKDASLIEVMGDDVSGLVFRLPENIGC